MADQPSIPTLEPTDEGDPRIWYVVAGVVALVVAAILVFTPSDSSDDAASDDVACADPAPLPEGVVDGKPETVELPSDPPTTEVATEVLREGDGPEVTDVSYVTVDYVGVSCTTGEQFDSSWDRGQPITIAVGNAEPTATAFTVIPGWSEGLIGQQQGSLIKVDIPSDLAYGPQGSAAIPPNDPLTFVIDILEVSETPPA